MNTRLKHTHGQKLNTLLTGMEEDLAQIKAAPQYLGGASVVFTMSQSENDYDWSGTPGTEEEPTFLLVTVTAETAPVLFSSIASKMFVGSLDNWYRPSDTLSSIGPDPAVTFAQYFTDVPNDSGTSTAVNQAIITLSGDGSTTVYLKLYCYALDGVTFTVEEL